ncbi:hypothetical protein HZA39_04480 [Candidatus Peregrinibacteria bacterium]|nr:hypothetical protein [Candidatus Peregrinibacteria bacterium]
MELPKDGVVQAGDNSKEREVTLPNGATISAETHRAICLMTLRGFISFHGPESREVKMLDEDIR